jgi:putative ABC transport system permease protein
MRLFGDLQQTRRYCKSQDLEKESGMQATLLVDELKQDASVSLRSLWRVPTLATTILLTVGLGIGSTTAIFSAVDAALLRPLPYRDPARLVRIYTDAPPNKFPFSVVDYLALEAQQTRFERIAGYSDRPMSYSNGAVAERLPGRLVTWTYFDLLGIRPAMGRLFAETDGRPGSPQTVIASHHFWQERLGGRSDALGQTVRLDGADHSLIGVLPPLASPLEQGQEFFIPAQWETPSRKGPFFIRVLGRLRSEADLPEVAAELRAINQRLFPIWRASYQDERASWGLVDLKTQIVGNVSSIAGLALSTVALVWLIACANASSLLIARVTSRRRELAVRSALGASRARVIRHLLVESALLAIGSAAVGIAMARVGVTLLRGVGASYVPRAHEITLDGSALALLGALTLASAVLFGLVPAVHGTGGPVNESLRALGRSATAGTAAGRLRSLLVGAQFTVTTPLLIMASLLIASLNHLSRVDLGFDTRNLVSGAILVPRTQYPEPGRVAAFWDELQRRVEALPGVAAVAFADGRAPNDVGNQNNFELEASPPGQPQPVTP